VTTAPAFQLLPLERLRAHEEIDEGEARRVAADIRARGIVDDPIWVAAADDLYVILNGHHRVAALRQLGATLAPAWVLDYASDAIRLERWSAGPPIDKAEVVRRARSGEMFPPKTTRHVVSLSLPARPTSLADLGTHPVPAGQRRASARSRPSGAETPGSG
jgi:L-serine kinase (ADP)